MPAQRIAFIASDAPAAKRALARLAKRYGNVETEKATVIVALGGDGLMLQTLHRFVATGLAIYGMNRGSVGFLMNDYEEAGLLDRLAAADETVIHPLRMTAVDIHGKRFRNHAFNEVSLLRQRHQAAKLRVSIDGKVRLEELICDGIIVSTPAGSTAYNFSAYGPILPIDARALALTPISAFRPRRWRGAILPQRCKVDIEILEPDKRPVAAVADHIEVREVAKVSIAEDRKSSARILFDNGRNLAERVLIEQFQI